MKALPRAALSLVAPLSGLLQWQPLRAMQQPKVKPFGLVPRQATSQAKRQRPDAMAPLGVSLGNGI